MSKNKKSKKTMLGYISFVVLIIIIYIALGGSNLVNKELSSKIFVINKGQGLNEISENLEKQGIIKNDELFQVFAFFKNVRSNFLPGKHEIKKGMNLSELIKTLTSAPKIQEKQITILEGTTNIDIASKLEKNNLLTKEEFFNKLEKLKNNQEFLNKYEFINSKTFNQDKEETLQGFLYPDTYRFYKEADFNHIITKILDNFNKKVYQILKPQINSSQHSFYDVLTLASIVEKEMDKDRDRRLAADVFWGRLKINWALQSDATINYILNTKKLQPTFKDTRTPSPYNTYMNPGLPPGPINNPSFSSIRATLDPIENDYCCFLVTPEGENLFSKTIEEHNRKKQKYWGD